MGAVGGPSAPLPLAGPLPNPVGEAASGELGAERLRLGAKGAGGGLPFVLWVSLCAPELS